MHLSNLDDGLYSLFLYLVFFRAFCAFRGLRFFIRYMRNISYFVTRLPVDYLP